VAASDDKKFKDPDERLDFAFDWATSFLAEDETITSYAVTAPAGIVIDTDSETAGVVTVWLTGGTVDVSYPILCRVTTSTGRIKDEVRVVRVRDEQ
jgi:hypothetical protein